MKMGQYLKSQDFLQIERLNRSIRNEEKIVESD